MTLKARVDRIRNKVLWFGDEEYLLLDGLWYYMEVNPTISGGTVKEPTPVGARTGKFLDFVLSRIEQDAE